MKIPWFKIIEVVLLTALTAVAVYFLLFIYFLNKAISELPVVG